MPKSLSFWFVCFCWNVGMVPAVAQTYPERPVRLLVGFAAGGSVDTTGRVLAQSLATRWGRPVVVENRAGAVGLIAMQIAEKAPTDGYTLMMGSASQFTVGPALEGGQSSYPPLSRFTPIAKLVVAPAVLTVHPSLPIHTLKDLIQYAKSRPGPISYGSTGVGTPNHIAMALISRSGGFEVVHVPYKGGGDVVVAAVGGQVPLAMGSFSTALPHIRSGRLRALGVTESRRLSIAPDLPTIAESGLPGFEVSQWYGLFAPAGIPPALTKKIGADVAAIVVLPDVKERFESQGLDVSYAASAEFGAYIKAELIKWTKLVKELGLETKAK
jgi:tripartite-type tricarboxylate transporter receptor subunit TctC